MIRVIAAIVAIVVVVALCHSLSTASLAAKPASVQTQTVDAQACASDMRGLARMLDAIADQLEQGRPGPYYEPAYRAMVGQLGRVTTHLSRFEVYRDKAH